VADELVRYSDNWIDLEPGEARELSVEHPQRELRASELRLGYA
jgi:hypothetical protein